MDYFEKLNKNPYEDLKWNIPERKQGTVNIIGGNAQNFRLEMKVGEFLTEKYPLEMVGLVLPEALKNKLPNLPNFKFLPATEVGTFADSQELVDVFSTADFNLVLGDFSKNAITGRAIAGACRKSERMILATRDAIEPLTENEPEKLLMNENLILLASMPQLQKIFRAVYYPKVLTLSQSLMQVAEALHKFTLSYPIAIVTLHNRQILVAEAGVVKAVPLAKSGYSPIEFWNGELAAKIVAMNLYNPNSFTGATLDAIFE